MLRDAQGLEVTTNSSEAIAAINCFIDQSLRYGNQALTILKGIEADPTCAIAHAYAATYYLSQESAETRRQAAPYLKAAKRYLFQSTEREKLYVWAIDAWASGDIDKAIAYHEAIAQQFPRDLASVQMGQYHYFYLGNKEKEDIQKVLELYDTQIWGRACKESAKDQIGAIQVLLRLELRGIDIGDRWLELGTYLTARVHEHALPFQDLHYVYALARAERTDLVTEMLKSMQAYAITVKPYIQQTWAEVVVPAARGMAAHARGEWETAVLWLRPTLPRLYQIGGSHAQRDLFEQIYLDAWLRVEHNHEALHLLEKRVATHRYIPLIQRGRVLTYNKLGLTVKTMNKAV